MLQRISVTAALTTFGWLDFVLVNLSIVWSHAYLYVAFYFIPTTSLKLLLLDHTALHGQSASA